MSATLLHVMPAVTGGGPTRALLSLVEAVDGVEHHVASLRPVGAAWRGGLAERGLSLLEAPAPERLDAALAAADLVQLHVWNTPELHERLRRPWPDARLVSWLHVRGGEPPQVLPAALAAFSDVVVAGTPGTLELEHLRADERPAVVIGPVADARRVTGTPPRPHDGVVVGYLGTVDPAKMHPDFVALCARVRAPDVRFVVCGSGGGVAALARDARAAGVVDRFELLGHRDDVATVLAGFDVLGYPLTPGNYSTGELVLQEAMHAGVPPVVLPHAGAGAVVEDGVTGIVAPDEDGYVAALELLARNAPLRRRLGAQAQAHARRTWTPERTAAAWHAVHDDVLARLKRARAWPGEPPTTGAGAFVDALGPFGAPFRASLAAADAAAGAVADAELVHLPAPVLRADGGLVDYARRHPADAHLHLWTGLALAGAGQRVPALGELTAAVRCGLPADRVASRVAALTGALAAR